MGYYREDNWVQSKFEDQDHRVVKTRLKSGKSDLISDFLKYRAVVGYQVDHYKLDYIATKHGG